MSEGIYSQTLKDTLEKNDQLIATLRARLKKHQQTFRVDREEIADMTHQLETMAYLAGVASDMLCSLVENLRSDVTRKNVVKPRQSS